MAVADLEKAMTIDDCKAIDLENAAATDGRGVADLEKAVRSSGIGKICCGRSGEGIKIWLLRLRRQTVQRGAKGCCGGKGTHAGANGDACRSW